MVEYIYGICHIRSKIKWNSKLWLNQIENFFLLPGNNVDSEEFKKTTQKKFWVVFKFQDTATTKNKNTEQCF
jgi:hypothetical protein